MKQLGRYGLSQTHPVQDALKALNEADVVRVGIPTDKVLLNAFQGEEQAWELL